MKLWTSQDGAESGIVVIIAMLLAAKNDR